MALHFRERSEPKPKVLLGRDHYSLGQSRAGALWSAIDDWLLAIGYLVHPDQSTHR